MISQPIKTLLENAGFVFWSKELRKPDSQIDGVCDYSEVVMDNFIEILFNNFIELLFNMIYNTIASTQCITESDRLILISNIKNAFNDENPQLDLF
jgi:hypothetical protein